VDRELYSLDGESNLVKQHDSIPFSE